MVAWVKNAVEKIEIRDESAKISKKNQIITNSLIIYFDKLLA